MEEPNKTTFFSKDVYSLSIIRLARLARLPSNARELRSLYLSRALKNREAVNSRGLFHSKKFVSNTFIACI